MHRHTVSGTSRADSLFALEAAEEAHFDLAHDLCYEGRPEHGDVLHLKAAQAHGYALKVGHVQEPGHHPHV